MSEHEKDVSEDTLKQALEEAEARRAAAKKEEDREAERGGPKGAEPTRFGDWERKGIAYDF